MTQGIGGVGGVRRGGASGTLGAVEAVVWSLLVACSDYSVQPAPGRGDAGADIEVAPAALSMGPAGSGESVTDGFVVRNVGTETLHVTGLSLASGAAAFTLLDDGPFDVAPGEEVRVEVAFSPPAALTYGEVLVASDDPDEPEVPVALEGLGQVPALEITPDHHTFTAQCPDDVALTLENVGLEVLRVTGADYDAPPDLSIGALGPFPFDLAPGQSVAVTVSYDPSGSGNGTQGRLTVASTDPRGDREAIQGIETLGGDEVRERFVIEGDPPIDILFAIDKSCSMSDDTRALGNAFEEFIADVDAATQSWRIGVVSKDSGCFNQGIIRPNTPDYDRVFLDAVSSLDLFASTDLTEALLALVDVSLRQLGAGECNEGFVRPNALLHIVTVSDEPEQSGQRWDHWVGRYQAGMSDPDLVVVSVVADLSGCEAGAAGYVEAAAATGGLALDICSPNWNNFAAQLGAASAEALNTFLLGAVPDPDSIVVEVDGEVRAGGWHYDPVRNALVIDVDLPEGTVVTVTYDAVGC